MAKKHTQVKSKLAKREIFTHSLLPKGILAAIGGNEDKEQEQYILNRIVALANKASAQIAVVTTASQEPEEIAADYLKAFGRISGATARPIHIRSRVEAEDSKHLEQIQAADIVFFTGGDQLRLTSILGGTPFLESLVQKYYQQDFVIAGTSAGAAAMSQTMIYAGDSAEALLKDSVKYTAGFGLIENAVIDSHFIQRGRFSRLMELVASNPGNIGVGLSEDTGVIIRQGHRLETIGQNLVVIIEGKHIRHSNLAHIRPGEAIAVENYLLHTLADGYGYDLRSGEFLIPDHLQEQPND